MTQGTAGEWLWDPPELVWAALLLLGTLRAQVKLLMWQQFLCDSWGWRSPEAPAALQLGCSLVPFPRGISWAKRGIWAWVAALRMNTQGSVFLRIALGNELHLKENISSAERGINTGS